jgi:UDP-N-acetylglucosamine 1-carboxyvinyltransferase
LEELGPETWRLRTPQITADRPTPDLCRRIRASMLVAGPMLARHGMIMLPLPGGDVIGRRRLDTHLLALEALGAEIRYDQGQFHMTADGLSGAAMLPDECSVMATENAVMAAVLADGERSSATPRRSHMCRTCVCSSTSLGARIENIGSNCLVITGVAALGGGDYTIGADYLEVASYIGAAAVTGGSIRIAQAGVAHLDMIRLVFERLGVRWTTEGDDVLVPSGQSLTVVPTWGRDFEIDNVWPAFPRT